MIMMTMMMTMYGDGDSGGGDDDDWWCKNYSQHNEQAKRTEDKGRLNEEKW